ncbi:hypothetical protein D3C79_835770 [compost metagenome]
MFVAIEAAQANTGGQPIHLLHPQLTIVVDGVEITIDDVTDRTLAGVYPDRRPVAQYRQHAVAANGHALGLIELHTIMAQAAFAKAQASTLAFLDDESS